MRARQGGWEARNVVPPYPPPARRDSGCRSPACASGGRLGTGQLPERQPGRQREQLRGRGRRALRLSNASENIGGFTTQTSFDRGENVPLKIARNAPTFPARPVDITVYRMG